MIPRTKWIAPIIVEPVRRPSIFTTATTSANSSSVVSTLGSHISMTSSMKLASSSGEIPMLPIGPSRPVLTGRSGNQHQYQQLQLVCVGAVSSNGVTRTLFIERAELPPSGSARRMFTVAPPYGRVATAMTQPMSFDLSLEPSVLRKPSTVSATVATPADHEQIASYAASVHVSGNISRLQDPHTAASLTAALATYLPRPTTSTPSSVVTTSAASPTTQIGAKREEHGPSAPPLTAEPLAAMDDDPHRSSSSSLFGSGLTYGSKALASNTVVMQSVLGKRTVTLTSTRPPKRVIKSSVVRSIRLQPPTLVVTSSSDTRDGCSDDRDEWNDDGLQGRSPSPAADNDADPSSSVFGTGHRQYVVRLTSTASSSLPPVDQDTEVRHVMEVADVASTARRKGAADLEEKKSQSMLPSATQTPSCISSSVQASPTTSEDALQPSTVVVAQTTGKSQERNTVFQQQHQHSAVRESSCRPSALVEPPNGSAFAPSQSLPVEAQFGVQMNSVGVSTSLVQQSTFSHVQRGSSGVFTVGGTGRGSDQLPSSNRCGAQMASSAKFRDGRVQLPHRPTDGTTTNYTPILPAPITRSIPVSVLAMSRYRPGIGSLNCLTSTVSSGSFQRSLVSGAVTNGPKQPIDIGSAGVIQHAPAAAAAAAADGPACSKPATLYLPSGQSLICLPQQTNAMARTAGTGLLYGGIPLQPYSVIPSSNSHELRYQAFSMVQPLRYSNQINQQWPPQPTNSIADLSELPNGKVLGGLQINPSPSQGMRTITQQLSAIQREGYSAKRYDCDALLPHLQRHLQQHQQEPQHQQQQQQQQQQQPVSTFSSSTKRTTNSTSNLQPLKPTAARSAVKSAPITRATPYYLRRRAGRACLGIADGSEAVRAGEDERRHSRSGNCGRIIVNFFSHPKKLCGSIPSRHRVLPLDVDNRIVHPVAMSSSIRRSDEKPMLSSLKKVYDIDADVDATIGDSSTQQQQSQMTSNMPPLAMLEALCLRINDDNRVKPSLA